MFLSKPCGQARFFSITEKSLLVINENNSIVSQGSNYIFLHILNNYGVIWTPSCCCTALNDGEWLIKKKGLISKTIKVRHVSKNTLELDIRYILIRNLFYILPPVGQLMEQNDSILS
ncbi:hypothetical protein BpHYR1_048332 [Brachionus plicatilis]|uniref:Uncharacterized protein n=1 Tax=Brachionus plicatilis TaxID=10195 RepID=A0A3M7PE34_BRAPC|nr:hypothetical protein BpHYR1_048332 [Brachionus plicatilis]